MFDNYSGYDSVYSDREREEKLMQDKKERCHKNGTLYFVYFWLSIIGAPIIILLAVVGAVFAVLLRSTGAVNFVFGVIGALAIAGAVAQAVILFIIGRDESCFKVAGVAYVILTLLDIGANFVPEGWLQSGCKLLAAVAGLFYLFEFINGSSYILAGVDNYVAGSWETIKKVYIYLILGIVTIVVFMIVPVTRAIALIALFILTLGAFGVIIWEYVLMFKTARALKNF